MRCNGETMNTDRRTFLAIAAATAALPSTVGRATPGAEFRPEDYGARGDGATNDSAAFAAMSQAVNRAGGGTIALAAGRTYLVGTQRRGNGQYGWNPSPLIDLRGLARPLILLGNGATLKCQPGLRFGAFDPASGRRGQRALPNYHLEEVATPYLAMVSIRECRTPILIRDLELDGNSGQLVLGGPYGDTGRQIPASGLFLADNRDAETITNLNSHHHPTDGVQIDGDGGRSARSMFDRVICRHNGRQGMSMVGGRGYDFNDCEFSHTGRASISSAPGAGVDIEAEGSKINRDLRFTRCRFVDNVGAGMVADSGESSGATFTDCTFVGTTSWSAWPAKPDFAFIGCSFVGSVARAFADKADPSRATRFIDCQFSDDPAKAGGMVYLGGGPIVNMGESNHILFRRCRFDLVADGVLPWSWRAIYDNCTMRQRSRTTAITKGRFLGTTSIDGPVDLYGSIVEGSLTLNGQPVPRGPKGVDPW